VKLKEQSGSDEEHGDSATVTTLFCLIQDGAGVSGTMTVSEIRESIRLITQKSITYGLKLNPVALVHERTIPTERPPLVGEVSANFLRIEGVAWSAQRIPTVINLGFLDRITYGQGSKTL
jgi:hypothetical protein